MCRQLRGADTSAPVLILTGRADETTIVVGLDAGADDYVTKPFRFAELLARVRSLIRRTHPSQHSDDHPIHIDPPARRVYLNDHELVLTPKEFDVLAVLHREEGRAVPREQLMREVWDVGESGSSKTLDMHISLLRHKLGDDAHRPHHIFTVRGIGFRFQNDPH